MENKFIIPVEDKIEEFLTHLDSHPRTILSAKYGDGKSYFLDAVKKNKEASEKFKFITIYPVNYQVASNDDIFELIKRNLLLQLIVDGVIEEDYEISDSVAFSFFLINKCDTVADCIFPFLESLNTDNDLISAAIKAFGASKMFGKLSEKIKEFKKEGSKDEKLKSFFEKAGNNPSIENDPITAIIRDSIKKWKEANPKKKLVLVFEDMDRIDPAHLFRIMNILSAHVDCAYNWNLRADEETTACNKLGVDNVLLVLDYENLKNIFYHFYGENTNFQGYISKFASRSYFKYSLEEEKLEYCYKEIFKVTGLPVGQLKKIIEEDWLKGKDLRRFVESLTDIDPQIKDKAKYYYNKKDYKILSLEMLRLLVILRRLNLPESLVVSNLATFIDSDPKQNLQYFAAFALQHCKKFPATFLIPGSKGFQGSFYGEIDYNTDLEGNVSTKINYYRGPSNGTVTYDRIVSGLYDFISQ